MSIVVMEERQKVNPFRQLRFRYDTIAPLALIVATLIGPSSLVAQVQLNPPKNNSPKGARPSAPLPPPADEPIETPQPNTTKKQGTPRPQTPPKSPRPSPRATGEDGWEPPNWLLPKISASKFDAHGIRKLSGRHIDIYTDIPASPEVDELPAVFDAAVPQWCEYFRVDIRSMGTWRVAAYLMNDKGKFQSAGALRQDTPRFRHGYQQQLELWLNEQPSDYYRRHLMLHEGTHAFMSWRLGGLGPPWYAEGMAELLATHLWSDGRLWLRYFPRSREEVPEWGRIKIVKTDVAAGRLLSLEQIFQYDSQAHLQLEPYGWCWAAVSFFDAHPRWSEPFRQLQERVSDSGPAFSQQLFNRLKSEWPAVKRDWQLFVNSVDYGYDIARLTLEPRPPAPIGIGSTKVRIVADRGWQSTGVRVQAGRRYRVSARGRFQLTQDEPIWWSEPNGVTIQFYRKLPIGMLIGGILDEEGNNTDVTGLLNADAIGAGRGIVANHSGTLYLRINDAPGDVADNAGFVDVFIDPE